MQIPDEFIREILKRLKQVKGGYVYSGACSYQICFPLRGGDELRFCTVDDDQREVGQEDSLCIELYKPMLQPGVTGFVESTGEKG